MFLWLYPQTLFALLNMLSHIEMPDYNNPSDRTCTIRYHEVAETLHPDTKQPLWSWDYKWVPERLDPPD
jgi:hypothetical protein